VEEGEVAFSPDAEWNKEEFQPKGVSLVLSRFQTNLFRRDV
jgi:hypothetical protein